MYIHSILKGSECSFHFSCIWDLLGFLDWWACSFYQIGKFSAIIPSNRFFVLPPFRDCNYTYIRLLKVVPRFTDALFMYLFLFSIYFFLDIYFSFFDYIFKFSNISSVMSNNLLLFPSSLFFITDGTARSLIWIFKNIFCFFP